jgi:hypothetical protein
MKIRSVLFLIIILCLLLTGCTTTDGGYSFLGNTSTSASAKSLAIAGYAFELPSWWSQVNVTVPDTLKAEDDIRNYVYYVCGLDTGTINTWKQALKIWALACERLRLLPVYIAHCYKAGGDLAHAAKVYSDLYYYAGTQEKYVDWYRVYLSFNAGETYALLGNKVEAITWYEVAAGFSGNADSAINYYASQSIERIKTLKKTKN